MAMYESWLRERLAHKDPDVSTAMREIEESDRLGCWCAPLRCHCDVIIAVWRELRA